MTIDKRNATAFKKIGISIQNWKKKAEQLFFAAELIWNAKHIEHHARGSPSKLLMGLSLENLLKGLLIHRDNSLLDGGKLNKQLVSHSLKSLFKMADIDLTQEDEVFVKGLAQHVEWIAKYPLDVNIVNYKKKKYDGIFCATLADDFDNFKRLYNLVLREFLN